MKQKMIWTKNMSDQVYHWACLKDNQLPSLYDGYIYVGNYVSNRTRFKIAKFSNSPIIASNTDSMLRNKQYNWRNYLNIIQDWIVEVEDLIHN